MSIPDLWSFSLSVYGIPDVADACLTAQDQHGGDVNLLLWAVWLAAHGHDLTAAEVSAAVTATRPWNEAVVQPLRAVRRQLKSGPPPAPDTATQSLRSQVQAAELAAERVQQSVLQNLPAQRRCQMVDAALVRANLSLLPGGDGLAMAMITALPGIIRSVNDDPT
ncbi:TIGR02444 family protein [Niveispirillum lacus]|uniref:TIGR02444 family protein n=1 Tax=Niveispirillum lacus TaxID=1981099 RepID=UPI0013FE220D|nr:TIGR02444 family protein [Niveispirillum lacus]